MSLIGAIQVMEVFGLILAVAGLAFAFETPRRMVVGMFKRTPDVVQSFKVQTHFRFHNDGKVLDPIGSNKTDKKYVLEWVVTNHTAEPIQIERGIVLKGASAGHDILLRPPQLTTEQTILPRHKHPILAIELTPSEVDHYRHWVRESTAFGFKTTDGVEHFIDGAQFNAFSAVLENIAMEYGLAVVLPEGKQVVIKIVRNPVGRP